MKYEPKNSFKNQDVLWKLVENSENQHAKKFMLKIKKKKICDLDDDSLKTHLNTCISESNLQKTKLFHSAPNRIIRDLLNDPNESETIKSLSSVLEDTLIEFRRNKCKTTKTNLFDSFYGNPAESAANSLFIKCMSDFEENPSEETPQMPYRRYNNENQSNPDSKPNSSIELTKLINQRK